MDITVRPDVMRVAFHPDGTEADCFVEFNPMSQGVQSNSRGIIVDGATHTLQVFEHWDDVVGGEIIRVESDDYPTENFQVLREGVDRTPYGVVLYVRLATATQVDPTPEVAGQVDP